MYYELKIHNDGKDFYWWDGNNLKGSALTDDVPESLHCGTFSASVHPTDGGIISLGRFDTHEESVAATTHAMANNKTYAEWLKELDS